MFIKKLWVRHLIIAIPSILLIGLFWYSRRSLDPDHRLWRAFGDTSWVLLCLSLMIGPVARLRQSFARFAPWRREIGIWFGVLALVHALLILNTWVQWDIMQFFGYEYVEQLGGLARMEPGFGLANAMGLVALIWALILTATSSNWAIRQIGGNAWKWLHTAAYVIFYLVFLHAFYFLFMHFTVSIQYPEPENPNWLAIPFVIISLSVPVLQALAFTKTVLKRKQRT